MLQSVVDDWFFLVNMSTRYLWTERSFSTGFLTIAFLYFYYYLKVIHVIHQVIYTR